MYNWFVSIFYAELHDQIKFALLNTLRPISNCTKGEMREYGRNDLVGCRLIERASDGTSSLVRAGKKKI